MDQNNILKLIRTTEERDELIDLLEIMLQNIFKDKAHSAIKNVQSSIMKNLYSAISYEFETLKISNDIKEIEKYLNSLLLQTKNLRTLKMSIATPPTEKLIQSLSKWAEKNLSGKTIFDIKVDSKILGGAIIINKEGDYSDFSLLKKIDDVFLNQKQEILNLQ